MSLSGTALPRMPNIAHQTAGLRSKKSHQRPVPVWMPWVRVCSGMIYRGRVPETDCAVAISLSGQGKQFTTYCLYAKAVSFINAGSKSDC